MFYISKNAPQGVVLYVLSYLFLLTIFFIVNTFCVIPYVARFYMLTHIYMVAVFVVQHQIILFVASNYLRLCVNNLYMHDR